MSKPLLLNRFRVKRGQRRMREAVLPPAVLQPAAGNRGGGFRLSRLPDDYFDELYAQAGDPWDLATRWYEQRKYAITLALLPRQHYAHAFEPGCSIGVLTALLTAAVRQRDRYRRRRGGAGRMRSADSTR